jgi:hypothetical protein
MPVAESAGVSSPMTVSRTQPPKPLTNRLLRRHRQGQQHLSAVVQRQPY